MCLIPNLSIYFVSIFITKSIRMKILVTLCWFISMERKKRCASLELCPINPRRERCKPLAGSGTRSGQGALGPEMWGRALLPGLNKNVTLFLKILISCLETVFIVVVVVLANEGSLQFLAIEGWNAQIQYRISCYMALLLLICMGFAVDFLQTFNLTCSASRFKIEASYFSV